VAEQEKLGQTGVTTFRKDASLRVAELDKEREIGEALAKYTKVNTPEIPLNLHFLRKLKYANKRD
jgi:hypothetical protein